MAFERFEERCNGHRICRLQESRWPDGFCTIGFAVDLPTGRFYEPTLAQARELAARQSNPSCPVEPSMALSRALNRGASIAHWAPWYRARVV